MNQLIYFDRNLFFLINHLPHYYLIDLLALIISGAGSYGVIWLIVGIVIYIREENKDHHFIFLLLGTAGISYLITEIILKNLIRRPRPEAIEGALLVSQEITRSYSFPSGHATFAFALATILSFKEPKLKFILYSVAILICLTRIYLGRHYPLDVVGGAVIGFIVGKFTIILEKTLLNK